jgi:hypothetical protein
MHMVTEATFTVNASPEFFLIAGAVMVVAGVALLVVAARIRSRWGAGDPRRAHAVGTVVGGGHVNYGNNYVPRCSYVVGGKSYEVDGPLFESGTFAPGMRCNCTSREDLPAKFRGPALADRLVDLEDNDSWYRQSALYPLYPVGSAVDIYYDPSDPSDAYVQRPVRKGVVAHTMTLIWGVGLVLMGVAYIIIWRLLA